MTFKISVPDLVINLDKAFVRRVLRQAGRQVVTDAKALLSKADGPSSPGQAPHSHTGTLRRDLKVRQGRGLSVKLVDSAYYALALENGAIGGGGKAGQRNLRRKVNGKTAVQALTKRKLLPRPFLSTALDSNRASITDQIGRAVRLGIDLKTLSAKGHVP